MTNRNRQLITWADVGITPTSNNTRVADSTRPVYKTEFADGSYIYYDFGDRGEVERVVRSWGQPIVRIIKVNTVKFRRSDKVLNHRYNTVFDRQMARRNRQATVRIRRTFRVQTEISRILDISRHA